MIIEEAGEIVLKADPWAMCAICRGSGRTTKEYTEEREKCWCCEGAGFFLPPDVEMAYQVLNAEIPPKPLTPVERVAKSTGDWIRGRLNEPSAARRMFPPEQMTDEQIDKFKNKYMEKM